MNIQFDYVRTIPHGLANGNMRDAHFLLIIQAHVDSSDSLFFCRFAFQYLLLEALARKPFAAKTLNKHPCKVVADDRTKHSTERGCRAPNDDQPAALTPDKNQ